MKEKKNIIRHLMVLCAIVVTALVIPSITKADVSDYQAGISTNRSLGQVTYTINGLDPEQTDQITLRVTGSSEGTAPWEQSINITSENCVEGSYTGNFSLADLNYSYDTYAVSFIVGETQVSAGNADLSIHKNKIGMTITGGDGSASRTINLVSTESAGEVLIPGEGNQVSVMAWPDSANENTATVIGAKSDISGNAGLTWPADISSTGTAYGKWNAKLVLTNKNKADVSVTLASNSYSVAPTITSIVVKKTAALESKKSFSVYIYGLKNVYGINNLSFRIYNSAGKKVATVAGQRSNTSGSQFSASVTMKKLGYALGVYTIKAVVTDKNGNSRTISQTATADQSAKGGTLSITKKSKNASCTYKLVNAYLPGYIKKAEFVLYRVKGNKKKKLNTYKVKSTSGKKKITTSVTNLSMGSYYVKAYGYTKWNKRVLLNEQSYVLSKKDMGKNGWYYKKYNGKKYKLFYVNNVVQTDVTKQLKLKKSSSTHTNNFYIEINRAACTVTIYMKNEETGKYDLPVKTCTVSVGSDTSTVAGSGSLGPKTYYTPIGNYSICTNGQASKYTLKPMYEPDGKILYARWATHIVGNVYFHSIAVSAQSHYALPSSTYNRLGSPASAGCIRMTVADAKWIYDYASVGSTVKIVKGNSSKPGPMGKNAVIKTNGVNYDPTDPAVPDSQKKKDYKAKRISGYMTKKGVRVGY